MPHIRQFTIHLIQKFSLKLNGKIFKKLPDVSDERGKPGSIS